MAFAIRSATPSDARTILDLLSELARFEGYEPPSTLTEGALRDMLAPPSPKLHVLIAEVDGEVAGYVSFMSRFSAWTASEFIQIDDLYVRSAAQGRGVGRALMRQIATLAIERGQIVRWEVEPDNRSALGFYERLGATGRTKVLCRWEEDDMRTELSLSDAPART